MPRNTLLIHQGNTQESPRFLKRTTRVPCVKKGKLTSVKRKVVIGTKDKVIFLSKEECKAKGFNSLGNHSIPMYTKCYTHVYTGRSKAFYSDPVWVAKANEIKAARKKFLAAA